jgi:heme-degrading monooxygenase HmoA
VKVAASSRLARKREKRTLAPVQLPFLGLIEAAASATPGYLGQETWKSTSGERSNVVYYWSTLESLKAFSAHSKHLEAKSRYQQWYKGFHIVIVEIIKSYGDDVLNHITPNQRVV